MPLRFKGKLEWSDDTPWSSKGRNKWVASTGLGWHYTAELRNGAYDLDVQDDDGEQYNNWQQDLAKGVATLEEAQAIASAHWFGPEGLGQWVEHYED